MSRLLSIVIPVYNTEKFVGEAIQSALDQTLEDTEVIVVNDGSTDRSAEVIERFSDHPALRVVSQANAGNTAARNTGLGLAEGKYIGFLDSDDKWHPDKGARHVALLERSPDLDLTYSWSRQIDELGRDTGGRSRPRPLRPRFDDLVVQNLTGSATSIVFRRTAAEQVGGMRDEADSCSDHEFVLRIAALRSGNCAAIPECLYDYRTRHGQITADWRRIQKDAAYVLEVARGLSPASVARVERRALGERLRYLAYLAFRGGERGESLGLVMKAWATDPLGLCPRRRAWTTSLMILSTYLPVRVQGPLRDQAIRLRALVRRAGA